jgi:hypothetical protein
MDLSFPIFEIAIQELEGKPPNGFVGSSNLSCPSAMMLKALLVKNKQGFYLYITFTLEKVDIVAF